MANEVTNLLDELPTRGLRAQADVRDGQPSESFVESTPASDAAIDRLEGRRLLGYRMLHRLGAGGMGVVYLGEHLWLERLVAIKLLPPEYTRDEEAVARFRREMRAVGRLDHPNIVRATDAGEAEGVYFLVTEFIDGIDLARLVRDGGRVPCADACEIVRQAAEALEYARVKGLVHRDIKPSNLMITREGKVKLLDFGLARGKEMFTTLTSSGMFMGTLDYMAPEQAGDLRQVDTRADIYSLGCTLYFLITGAPPFGGAAYSTPASKLKGHLEDSPPPVDRVCRRAPLNLLTVLDRMLAKRPEDRFATPAEVARALATCCQGANLARTVGRVLSPNSQQSPLCQPGAWAALGDFLVSALWCLPRMGWRCFARGKRNTSSREQPLFSFSGLFLLALMLGLFLFTGFSCQAVDEQEALKIINGQTVEDAESVQFHFNWGHPR